MHWNEWVGPTTPHTWCGAWFPLYSFNSCALRTADFPPIVAFFDEDLWCFSWVVRRALSTRNTFMILLQQKIEDSLFWHSILKSCKLSLHGLMWHVIIQAPPPTKGGKTPTFFVADALGFWFLYKKTRFLQIKPWVYSSSRRQHWRTLEYFLYNLNLFALKPKHTWFCWTTYDRFFFKTNKLWKPNCKKPHGAGLASKKYHIQISLGLVLLKLSSI